MIKRHALTGIRQLLTEFPAVCILGPRQVGKTTLALQMAGQTGNGNLWLSGDDGLETFALSGHLDKKGSTISGTGILYDASGDQEVTFKAAKQ